MKRFIFALALLAPMAANADWVLSCDPPSSKTADKAASTTAGALVKHLMNIEYQTCVEGGGTCVAPATKYRLYVSLADSSVFVLNHSRLVYQFFKPGDRVQCAYGTSATKPGAPAVAAWDKLSAGNKAKIRALGLAPE